jgi:hypothetical protein
MALLSVALGGGCAVYEIPTLAGVPGGATGGGFGGLHDGDGSAGSPADPDGWGGQAASLAVDHGQGGASDGDGGARNSGTAGASGGSESAGEDGGAAGSWHGENQGGNGGAASGGGSVAGSTSCAAGWRNQSACDQCEAQVQPDLRACAVILDCYVGKNCGPSSCANTDQKCGPNVLGEGAAAYSVAQDVYACMCN